MFKVEAIGNLGADAEVRESNGSKFISFRIAHSEKFTANNCDQRERTQWIDVILSNAESKVLPFLKQGVKVYVRGHASLRVYSSPKERMMVAGIQVNAQDVELCGGIADDVPRELINPATSEVMATKRLYWCPNAPKGLKKNDVVELIDKKGNLFTMDYHGFITKPVEPSEQAES